MDGLSARIARVGEHPLLFEQHPQSMWLFDLDTLAFLAANDAAVRRYGYSREELSGMGLLDVCPPAQVPLVRRCFEKAVPNLVSGESRARTFQQRHKDGTLFDVELSWSRIELGGQAMGLAMAVDVTGASRGERMVLAQNGLLEMIARGAPLPRVLDELIRFAERELPGLLGSVLLLDDEGKHVRHGAAPSLPKVYTDAIDGLAVGPRAGSCGTAAYYGVAVLVHDIRTDPRWDGYREHALPHGLISCWSTPIVGGDGTVLGTFALYYREPRSPTSEELGFISIVTAVARIAIERDRAARELARTLEVQNAIFDALPAGVALVDREGAIVTVNGTWPGLRGVPVAGAGAQVGANFLALCGDAQIVAGIRQVLAGGVAELTLERSVTCEGQPRWFRVLVRPVGAERLFGALVGFTDVTARKQAELHVRESEQRYRQIFENDVTGDLVSGPDGTIVEGNPAFARLFGFASPADARGTSEVALFPDPARRTALLARLRDERSIRSVELELRSLGGTPVHVYANVVGSVGADGVLERVSWYFLDRTELKQLEEQLRQAQKMEAVGLLAGGVAHDFNNLLTVINSYSDLLLGRMGPSGPLTEMVAEIRAAGDRASALTRQLLAFGRKQVLTPTSLDLNDLLAGIETMLRRLIGEDIAIVGELSARTAVVYADRGQIEQVVLNLALNARDAMPTGGCITIATRDVVVDAGKAALHPGAIPGDYVAMIVRDTGHGMDAETARRIFEPFFTTKGAGKGTGLGLAMVYGIVRQSGGFVEVDSAPSQGTTFSVYLPQDRGQGSRRERRPRAPSVARGAETVLLVEDEAAIRALFRQVLDERGYRVLEAGDGEEALERAHAYPGHIDLLITDVVMPNMSGGALADRVRAARPGTKVLYISGYTDDAIVRHGVSEDQVALLSKPFTPAALLQRVREVLDQG